MVKKITTQNFVANFDDKFKAPCEILQLLWLRIILVEKFIDKKLIANQKTNILIIQCYDINLEIEVTTVEDGLATCLVDEGLYCDWLCSDYMVRVGCCDLIEPDIREELVRVGRKESNSDEINDYKGNSNGYFFAYSFFLLFMPLIFWKYKFEYRIFYQWKTVKISPDDFFSAFM